MPTQPGLSLRGDGVQSFAPSADRTQRVLLRIGTRGSPLALAQANEIRRRLAAIHGFASDAIALTVIRTTGDAIRDRPLAEAGGKGLFTKEIEEALLAGAIDIAVHSAKDMPTLLPAGLAIAAVPPREDARDVFISASVRAGSLRELAQGARLGTASLRRAALALRSRPDLAIVNLRGNVETRLRKLDEGAADATLLALAGLKRLGLAHKATAVLAIEEFLPAVGQGILAVEARSEDARVLALLAPLNDAASSSALCAERAFLAELDGSCRTPIAGYAAVAAGRLDFRGLIARPDGSACLETAREAPLADAARIGADAGRELRARAGPDFLRAG
jgi:hydroxymethylbilane synthase